MAVRNVVRALACLSTASIALAGALAISAPAMAASGDTIAPSSSSFTDESAPTKSLAATNGAWIGTWTNSAGTHTSRAYYTFNLAAMKGATVFSASALVAEKSANDCATDRAIEIWQTATPAKKITWGVAPAEQRLVYSGSPAATGCPGDFDIDFTDSVRRAISGTGIFTIEVRVPAGVEADAAQGRKLASFGLVVNYNITPEVPASLTVGGKDCADAPLWVNSTSPQMYAYLDDRDGASQTLGATFEVYPVGYPEQAEDSIYSAIGPAPVSAAGVPATPLADGGRYVARVRSNDGQADSPWSAKCRFNVDATPPRKAPSVTSTDYPSDTPSGGVFVLGSFTLSARGDKDIIGFAIDFNGSEGSLSTDVPGGTVTESFAPFSAGDNAMVVRGYDKAGNLGPGTVYRFAVIDNTPEITDHDPDALFGAPRHITVTPHQIGAVSYRYQVSYDEVRTSDSPDFTIFPTQPFDNILTVWTVDAAGNQSQQAMYFIHTDPTPVIASTDYPTDGPHGRVGQAGTFTFSPRAAGVTGYNYGFDGDGSTQTVAAGPDGTAAITYTPTAPGQHYVAVTENLADGSVTYPSFYSFEVLDDTPTFTSDVYGPWTSGGPGVTGHFTFTARQSGAVSFVYHIGDTPDVTVPVGPDGTATIAWTPTSGDVFALAVHTVDADGTASNATTSDISVWSERPTLTETDSGGVYTLTFIGHMAGTSAFVYRLDSGEEITVPARADGTATVTWTPDANAQHTVTVRSVSGQLRSGAVTLDFWVSG